jgi:hypothetical protein
MRQTMVCEGVCLTLGLLPGDVLTVDRAAEEPVVIHRAVALTYDAILTAIEAGILRPVQAATLPASDLAADADPVASLPAPPVRQHRAQGLRYLRLE